MRLMSAASVMRSQMCLTVGVSDWMAMVLNGAMIPISAVVSLPKLRISAVSGIPFPLPLAPLLISSASQTLRYLNSWDGSCSRQRPTWLMSSVIRYISGVFWDRGTPTGAGRRTMVWISLMAFSRAGVPPPHDGSNFALATAAARIGSNSSLVLKTCSIARRPPSSFIRLGSMWMSVRTSLMVQPSRFWYLVIRLAISIPVRE